MPSDPSSTASETPFTRSEAAIAAARRVIPTGVTSAVRLSTRPTPLVFERGSCARLWDVDGHEYVDYVLGYGPLLLGHDPQSVIEAVTASLDTHLLLGAQHRLEARLGELVAESVPSAELTCFSSTGSEAVAVALRIARAHTGRRLVVKFEGHYHGWLDGVAVNAPGMPAADETGEVPVVPATGGVVLTDAIAVLRWNELAEFSDLISRRGNELAAVILEPVPQVGLIEPAPGYLASITELARAAGAVVIFDEVVTGFRLALGGAQERYSVTPDLTVLAKALGAGFPVSAVAGRAEIMDVVANGTVGHMGTFNGHPPSFAAACAAVQAYGESGFYNRLERVAQRLSTGLVDAAAQSDSSLRVRQLGPMIWSWFGEPELDTYAAVGRADHAANQAFAARLLEHGVHIQPRGTWLLSDAHTLDDIDESVDAARTVLAELSSKGMGSMESVL